MNVVAGLDLGDKYSHVCLLDLEGNIVERVRVRTTVQEFEKYFGAWAPMRVVFEAGTHSLWVYRLLERFDHEALMADTHRLALITQSLSKGDERSTCWDTTARTRSCGAGACDWRRGAARRRSAKRWWRWRVGVGVGVRAGGMS